MAKATGTSEGRAAANLADRLLRLNVRLKAAEQGWTDANLGTIEPLSGHHVTHRAHGRNDSIENLAGLGRATHAAQHEGKK